MKSRQLAFNLIFLPICLACVFALVSGCGSPEKRKQKGELSVIRFHLETNPDGTQYTTTISVLRSTPMLLTVYTASFLDERSVLEAAVVEKDGTFAIQLQFDSRGRFNLESVTQANVGSRLAIFSEFGSPRWLAAPKITRPIKDGIYSFVPDCSRDEAERIVRGLNNLKRKQSRNEHFPEKPSSGGKGN